MPKFVGEQLGDLSFRFMNRRRDDVRRSLLGKLNDVLAEICFDDLQSRSFQSVVQVSLFGRHALAFDDGSRADALGVARR